MGKSGEGGFSLDRSANWSWVPKLTLGVRMILCCYLVTLYACTSSTVPVLEPVDKKTVAEKGIPVLYRPLLVEDFLATSPPSDGVDRAHRLNAHTGVSIRTQKGSGYLLSEEMIDGKKMCRGELQNLKFEAVMLPELSWWNPVVENNRRDYVLQHEQIHFAIMEREALSLNRRVAQESGRMVVVGEECGEVKRKLNRFLDDLLAQSQKQVEQLHSQFDKETSGQFAPVVQNRWYRKMTTAMESLK